MQNNRPNKETDLDLSFVVIGLNEEKHLEGCLNSVGMAELLGISHEVIYVDGGSEDRSIDIARSQQPDLILGGDCRRRAAENRNIVFLINNDARMINSMA